MKSMVIFSVFFLLSADIFAQATGILDGASLKTVTLEQSISSVMPGSIVIIGENHAQLTHQSEQLAVMQALRNKGLKVSVGLEFFTYIHQALVNQYRQGQLAEANFLKYIQWAGFSYEFYRAQAIFPDFNEGAMTVALNAPRSLTGKVSKMGLGALTPEDMLLLPPHFAQGRESYKERFLATMGNHLPSKEAGKDTLLRNQFGMIQWHGQPLIIFLLIQILF